MVEMVMAVLLQMMMVEMENQTQDLVVVRLHGLVLTKMLVLEVDLVVTEL